MKTVWVMTAWSDGCDGDRIIGVYEEFDFAADRAIHAIKEMEEDIFVHTECETEVRTSFKDGEALYELWASHGDNPPYQSDVIALTRYEVE